MGRERGSKNFNRRLLQEVLAEKNIDLIGDYYALLQKVDDDIKARMLMHLIEFVYPRRRAEDSSGTAGDSPPQAALTQTELLALVTAARQPK